MVSVETLKEQFDDLGVIPSDDILDKCNILWNRCENSIEFFVYTASLSQLYPQVLKFVLSTVSMIQ